MKKVIKIEGMQCPHCSSRVINAFKIDGIVCEVSLADKTATVSGDEAKLSDAALRDTVEALGFDVIDIKAC